MSKRITIEFPFGDDSYADVNGFYYPRQQGKQYLANGDPGFPDESSMFEIDSFCIWGNDILKELNEMYVKDIRGNFVLYIDTINDRLCEIADEQYYSEVNDYE